MTSFATAFQAIFRHNYRKPTKDEMQLVAPDAADSAKFDTVSENFRYRTWSKLIPNAGCHAECHRRTAVPEIYDAGRCFRRIHFD